MLDDTPTPQITVRKRHGWWWTTRGASRGVPFRTWREAYDYALDLSPWPKWFNGRS